MHWFKVLCACVWVLILNARSPGFRLQTGCTKPAESFTASADVIFLLPRANAE